MASPHAAWAVVKMIHGHPRFRFGALSLAVFATLRYTLWNLFKCWRASRKVQERKKQAEERKKIVKRQCENADAERIMSLHIDDLLNRLRNGTLTAVEVLQAFQKKALELDERFNMITEPIPEALELAKHLDQDKDKSQILHGLPVSIKENIVIAGYDSHYGMSVFINQIHKDDSVAVKVLKRHGAVPFVRTNIPQTMMSFCSSNPVYGETSNPHDATRGPGGSSSGEGSLIGGGGSFMGVGSDIGGSARVPAAFCGCYSLKTTNGRISYKGSDDRFKGKLALKPSICPMARDWDSLVLLSKVLMSEEMYKLDPRLPCLPFNEKSMNETKPLRIGYFTFDGNIHCQPPIIRAVMEAKTALEKMGHTLVPIDIYEMSPPGFPSGQFYGKLAASDRFSRYKRLLKYDKKEKVMKLHFFPMMFPPWVTQALSFLLSFTDKYASEVFKAFSGFRSMDEYMQHIGRIGKWQDKFMSSWQERNLDAIVCPVWPAAAPKLDKMHLLTSAGSYCFMFNTLDYPSGVIPITKVTKKDVEQTKSVYKPQSAIEKLLMKSVDGSEGMPVAVQCVALPFREETCLQVMREVEKGLQQ